VTLDELAVGARARVAGVGGERSSMLRLMELGLLPGTAVEVVRVAPLGDPLEIRLRGYSLSIRKQLAEAVELTAVEGPDANAEHT
jgi:ferrous iron transport protein A